jgi:hypothetical protein
MRRHLIVAFILVLLLALAVCASLLQRPRNAPRLSFNVSGYTTLPTGWHYVLVAKDDSRTGFVLRGTNSAEYGALLCMTNKSGVGVEGTFTTEILCDGKWIPAAVQSDLRHYGMALADSSALNPLVPLPNEPVEWRVNCSLQRSRTRIEEWVANVLYKVGLRYPVGIERYTLVSPGFRSEGIDQPVAPPEPPTRASVSPAADDRMLDSLPAPAPSGGR